MLCQSECACLHQTVNMEETHPKGRALMQMYRVIPQTKRGNKGDVCGVGVEVVNWSHQTFYGHLTSQQKQCQYHLNSQAGIQSVF